MKNAVKLLTLLHISFLVLSSLAASAGEVLYAPLMALFVLALLVVGSLAARRMRAEREEARGLAEVEPSFFSISGEGVRLSLALLAPTLLLIFLVSFLSSLLLGLFGIEGNSVPDGPLFNMVIQYALLPSVFEELVFRYLPMKLIAPYSTRWCIILSSLYFALAHADITQIPYALVAGIIFITLNLISKSVLPSILMHFLNNLISVLWIKYSGSTGFVLWYVAALVALALISFVPVLLMRKRYIKEVKVLLSGGEPLGESYAPALFILFTAILMLFNLFS